MSQKVIEHMKIALVGAGGVGKGTLGKKVSDFLDIPFLPSHITDTGIAMGIENSYKNTSSPAQALAFQWSIMMGQIYQERAFRIAGMRYIAERSTLDYVAYFLGRNLDDPLYLSCARAWANTYDCLIFIEPEFENTDQAVNSWKERDPKDQARTTEILRKEIKDNYTGKVILASGSPDERFQHVIMELAMLYRAMTSKSVVMA